MKILEIICGLSAIVLSSIGQFYKIDILFIPAGILFLIAFGVWLQSKEPNRL